MPRERDEFDRLWTRFATSAREPITPGWRAVAGAGGVVAVLGALLALAPALPINDMPQDLLIPLDGALRMTHGQRPHVDFVTPLGDLYYWVLGLAAAIRGATDPRLLALANLIAAIPIAAAAAFATRGRLPSALRVVVVLGIGLLALSPRTLDAPSLFGFNAMYNRWGWALAAIALLAALLEPEDDEPWWSQVPLIAGCLLAAAWTKVTFAVLIGAGGALALGVAPANRRAVLAGLGLGSALCGLGTQLPAGQAYLADLALVAEAGAGGPGLVRIERIAPVLSVNMLPTILCFVLVFALIRTRGDAADEARVNRAVLGVLGLLVLGGAIALQNHDATNPLAWLAPLLALAVVRRRPAEARDRQAPLASLATLLLFGVPIFNDLRTIGTGLVVAVASDEVLYPEPDNPLYAVRVLDVGYQASDGMVHLVESGEVSGNIYDNLPAPWPVDTPHILRDAMDLLREHELTDRKVASMTFSPWFPFMLDAPPPRGLPAWWHWNRTFGPRWHERACDALADTEVVLAPKVWLIDSLWTENEACVRREFTLLDETPLWAVWVRRADG